MKTSRLLLAAPLALLGSSAFAADALIEEPAPVAEEVVQVGDWTGFYAGIQLGGAFGEDGDDVSISPVTPALATAFSPGVNGGGLNVPDAGFSGDFDASVIGGLHIGYDHQFANGIVLGGIIDGSFTDIGDSSRARSRTPANYDFSRELDTLVTGRVRVGYALGRFLPYVTGGVAYGDVDNEYEDNSAATIQDIEEESNDIGYTVGGGVEAMVTQRISIGFEYLYTNLGDNGNTVNLAGPVPNNPFGVIGGAGTDLSNVDDFDFHTVQMKMSYRF